MMLPDKFSEEAVSTTVCDPITPTFLDRSSPNVAVKIHFFPHHQVIIN